jgi:hypothetical protein
LGSRRRGGRGECAWTWRPDGRAPTRWRDSNCSRTEPKRPSAAPQRPKIPPRTSLSEGCAGGGHQVDRRPAARTVGGEPCTRRWPGRIAHQAGARSKQGVGHMGGGGEGHAAHVMPDCWTFPGRAWGVMHGGAHAPWCTLLSHAHTHGHPPCAAATAPSAPGRAPTRLHTHTRTRTHTHAGLHPMVTRDRLCPLPARPRVPAPPVGGRQHRCVCACACVVCVRAR